MGFIRHAWPVLEPVTQFKAGWTIEAMADHLEAVTSGDIQNLLMNVPPGTMKSLMTSVFHGAWEWTFAPSTTIFSASHASTLAERDARKMRTLVGSQWYQDLWGHVVKPSSKWGDRYMENDRLGWRRPVAFEHMTGWRAKRVVVDDPLSSEGAESEAERDRAERIVRESLPSRGEDEHSSFVITMQRLNEKDTTGILLDLPELGFTHLMIPMEYEPDRKCITYRKNGTKLFEDPRTHHGELMFPERFPTPYVERLKTSLGAYGTAGQLQQRPAPRDGGLFKRQWFQIVDFLPMGGVDARAWDFASTKKAPGNDPDWTVGLKGKRTSDGIFYITDMYRERETPGQVAKDVKRLADNDGRNCAIRLPIDPAQAGKFQSAIYLAMLAGYPVNLVPVSGRGTKVARAVPAAAQAEGGMIKLVNGPWVSVFLEEIASFPAATHDDIVDALSDLIDQLATQSVFSYENVL